MLFNLRKYLKLKLYFYVLSPCSPTQGWGAGAGRSRVFLAPWSRKRSRLKKKSGARAAKKLAGSSALQEDKKHKEIVL